VALAAALILLPATSASAATTIDGPINLGGATGFAVLGASEVTDAGTSTISGDVGVSPGSSITGIPPANVTGQIHITDQPADLAQSDLTTAYNVAASLSPKESGITELGGRTLVPGVYSGGALQVTGDLTLAGTADSIWVFQASSSLTTGSGSHILLTGGASSCNVFWQVNSSATLGSGSQFVGTLMAKQSITAVSSTTIQGRLLANNGAVTLDSNVITRPTGCADASSTTVTTTSGGSGGTGGSGSGGPGSSNGSGSQISGASTALALTGTDSAPALVFAVFLLAVGGLFALGGRRRRIRRH
jgi:hypothetical protein